MKSNNELNGRWSMLLGIALSLGIELNEERRVSMYSGIRWEFTPKHCPQKSCVIQKEER